MKIAILVPLFLPKWLAGTELDTYNIAKYLVKRGHEVHVITSLDKGLPKESKEEGFCVHRIGFPKIRFLGAVIFRLKILSILRRINQDIIHAQGIPMGMPAFLLKKLLRKPYVVLGQGAEVYLAWVFKKPISKLVLRNADTVMALTGHMKREIERLCDKDIYVVPLGINLDNCNDLSREESRSRLQIKEEAKIIIFVGSLRPIKGVKYLIQAIDIINKEKAGVKLMLVGDGGERESLEQLVKDLDLESSVTFTGKVANEKVPEYMAASDVFVLPSLSEGFPVVTLEAMASGLPIVATRVGGMPEIVEDGENGFLVEPRNPGQIAERILLLLKDDQLREKMARSNREKAKRYSWENVVERLERVYLEVLNKPFESS